MEERMKISLQRALLGLVVVMLLGAMIPTGLMLDRRLGAALEQGVRDDLETAPLVLSDRFANLAGARMMHAREISLMPELVSAVVAGDSAGASARAAAAAEAFPGESAVVIGPDGRSWVGPQIPEGVVDETRASGMPVTVVKSGEALGTVALAPVKINGEWAGAAGVWAPMDSAEAATLSALTRSDVLITAPDDGMGPYTGRSEPAMGLFGLLTEQPVSAQVIELDLAEDRYLVVSATVPGGARFTFVRALSEELAVVPTLRAVGLGVFGLALLLSIVVGAWAATQVARPVASLADAAGRFSEGDLDARVRRSAITEVDRVAEAFEVMRDALAARIAELGAANAELEDRQERLSMLQAELVQRDRLSAAARLLAQLAHEVRNPVASVRNCLEVLRRRVDGDEEASELADLAIDELLRMHELAERMLDLHRPQSTEGDCDASAVAQNVAAVVRMGMDDSDVTVVVDAPHPVESQISADALKQILLNLVQNSLDAVEGVGRVSIDVSARGSHARIAVTDTGHGITADTLPRIFDPFFTTKADVRGVGLGLFTAAGLARGHGGRIAASVAPEGGAVLTVEVPLAHPALEASA